MRIPPWNLLLGALAILPGCAGSTSPSASASHPAAPATAVPGPVTDTQEERLVTLVDLTGHNPLIGQTPSGTGLADSTPGAVALGTMKDDSSDEFDNLEIVGDELKGKLAVLRIGSGRDDSNLLSVFAGVKNKTGHRLELEMQTIYRDREGRPLSDGAGGWIPITLKPHGETQYRSVAISADAADFLVRVRPAPVSAARANP